MIRILFVCHGNICRSVMAEYMMKAMVSSMGLADEFEIDSAAATREEIGNPIYRPARIKLEKMGVPIGDHRARLLTWADYDRYDYLIGMDTENMEDIHYIVQSDPDNKIRRLLSFTDHDRDIADPWYTGDFDTTYSEIQEGLIGLLNSVALNG